MAEKAQKRRRTERTISSNSSEEEGEVPEKRVKPKPKPRSSPPAEQRKFGPKNPRPKPRPGNRESDESTFDPFRINSQSSSDDVRESSTDTSTPPKIMRGAKKPRPKPLFKPRDVVLIPGEPPLKIHNRTRGPDASSSSSARFRRLSERALAEGTVSRHQDRFSEASQNGRPRRSPPTRSWKPSQLPSKDSLQRSQQARVQSRNAKMLNFGICWCMRHGFTGIPGRREKIIEEPQMGICHPAKKECLEKFRANHSNGKCGDSDTGCCTQWRVMNRAFGLRMELERRNGLVTAAKASAPKCMCGKKIRPSRIKPRKDYKSSESSMHQMVRRARQAYCEKLIKHASECHIANRQLTEAIVHIGNAED